MGADLFASIHVLLHKRDPRGTALWLGFIWFLPLIGPLLYLTFGINRIRRRALSLGVQETFQRPVFNGFGEPDITEEKHLRHLAYVVNRVVAKPLTSGNKVEPLTNGDEAFPAMLAAIEMAERSISLSTYIFDNDESGRKFVTALERAVQRGVQVRVLIDSAGLRYSWPPITRRLRQANIPHARFLPASLLTPWRVTTLNLRNHRKLLTIDGRIAFTGGMNIRHGNMLLEKPQSPVQDLHFQITGPVVAQLQASFVNDWAFAAHEFLDGEPWFPSLQESGTTVARVITDGPDGDFDNLRLTLLAALAEAHSSVQIVTPYFLPDATLISALNLAALRGVDVDIVLPQKSNLPYVQWASRAMWGQVLARGCRIWLTPPPFDHSKLMIVDRHWVLLGSANWDPRSLRLNFELNVEAYGHAFAQKMAQVVAKKMSGADQVTQSELEACPLPVRLRNAVAQLFSPYL
ncbi:cardiolipin synthetase 2 [Verrucomicrobium sp. GAS474]|uniref:cardiolipin synthase n=1 Tax=Verrucomicrobium sp. GAS474 TaxID=1882831 RepID=UPI000879A044|nr:cardiolipin synthase [Verrucomicrobium sp. GAS474]SDU19203.1 cardiolipin synthetase 2 [Verrucomicrobium sp. GAS474]